MRHFEARVGKECPPPAEDFGCEVAEAQKHSTAAGHHVIAIGLCNRAVDTVEIVTSASFQRIDPQAIVFVVGGGMGRFVPVAEVEPRRIFVTIEPLMQTTEGLNVTVQGLSSGARAEVWPSQMGAVGRPYDIVFP